MFKPMTQGMRKKIIQDKDHVGGCYMQMYGKSGKPEITTEFFFASQSQADRMHALWVEIMEENMVSKRLQDACAEIAEEIRDGAEKYSV